MGNRKRKGPYQDMINEIATPNVLSSPLWQTTKTDEHELSWFGRRLAELGVINDMATSTKPPGFFINWSTITGLVVVVSAVAGLWYFTWQTAYQAGQKDRDIQMLQERIAIAEKKAEAADTKATYAVAGTDEENGHKPSGKKEPKK